MFGISRSSYWYVEEFMVAPKQFFAICAGKCHILEPQGARNTLYPIGSMIHGTGILTYIYHKKTTVHVGKYTSPMDLIGTSILQYHWFFAMSGVGYWRTPGASCHWQTADGALWSLRRWDGDFGVFWRHWRKTTSLWPQKAPKGCQIKNRKPKNTTNDRNWKQEDWQGSWLK